MPMTKLPIFFRDANLTREQVHAAMPRGFLRVLSGIPGHFKRVERGRWGFWIESDLRLCSDHHKAVGDALLYLQSFTDPETYQAPEGWHRNEENEYVAQNGNRYLLDACGDAYLLLAPGVEPPSYERIRIQISRLENWIRRKCKTRDEASPSESPEGI